MPKKIIICCDGTGNEIKENESNVLKFYRLLKESAAQVAFYDPGVGTISNSGAWSTAKNKAKGVFGLATGYGLDANVLEAYRFLVRTYKPKDDIYLIGFSRGAHTVRVLAGFMNMVGVLRPHQEHLSSYAFTAYKQAGTKGEKGKNGDYDIAYKVQEVLDTFRPTIRFMGCWDTVASVIVPRADRLYLPALEALPFTEKNPNVEFFRHAMAIDERRRMFRVSRWKSPQKFKPSPYMKEEDAGPQDIKQVWFAGVHSDIGGGYPESESGAAKFPLMWMVDEARAQGLVFRETLVKRLVMGKNPKNVEAGSKRDYAAPDAQGPLHNSLRGPWKILEYLPKRKKWHEDPTIRGSKGFYIPKAEMRHIPEGSIIHPSVFARIQAGDYNPPNLPNDAKDIAVEDVSADPK